MIEKPDFKKLYDTYCFTDESGEEFAKRIWEMSAEHNRTKLNRCLLEAYENSEKLREKAEKEAIRAIEQASELGKELAQVKAEYHDATVAFGNEIKRVTERIVDKNEGVIGEVVESKHEFEYETKKKLDDLLNFVRKLGFSTLTYDKFNRVWVVDRPSKIFTSSAKRVDIVKQLEDSLANAWRQSDKVVEKLGVTSITAFLDGRSKPKNYDSESLIEANKNLEAKRVALEESMANLEKSHKKELEGKENLINHYEKLVNRHWAKIQDLTNQVSFLNHRLILRPERIEEPKSASEYAALARLADKLSDKVIEGLKNRIRSLEETLNIASELLSVGNGFKVIKEEDVRPYWTKRNSDLRAVKRPQLQGFCWWGAR